MSAAVPESAAVPVSVAVPVSAAVPESASVSVSAAVPVSTAVPVILVGIMFILITKKGTGTHVSWWVYSRVECGNFF